MTPEFKSAIGGMANLSKWFVWRLDWNGIEGKYSKKPTCGDAQQPANWLTYEQACALRAQLDTDRSGAVRYALGFMLTKDDPWWFLDLDHAEGNEWARQLVATYPGAFVEKSSSGTGMHVIGRLATAVDERHRRRPSREVAAAIAPLQIEFYVQARGIAFGLDGVAHGSADAVFDMRPLVHAYFPPRDAADSRARPEWSGPSDDEELLRRVLRSQSVAAAFNGKVSVQRLWAGDCDHNSEMDMSLASHLAFWTGCDAERMERLMLRSGLKRDKWSERRGTQTWLQQTIERACDSCANVYREPGVAALALDQDLATASPTSDLANARRLQRLHGNRMLSVPGIGWHVWNGAGPWMQDDQAAYRLAFDLGRVVQAEADAMDAWVNDQRINGSDEQKARREQQKLRQRWAKASESRTVIYNCLDLAAKLPGMYALPDSLDSALHLLGTPSGVLDLTTCAVRAHAQSDRITKRIACDYDPAARAPTWERFVGEVLGGDGLLIQYVQTLCGYMLSGERTEHVLPVFHGSGANGKSTLLVTLQRLMGDYADTAAPGLLIARSGGSEHPTGLAALQGRRLVVVSETSESGRLNEEQVKMLTGGDRITARRMRQDFYSFDPTHLIILQTNHKPRITGTDEGVWRRVKLVPFNVTIPPERRDPTLPAKLRAELPGILAWAVRGWQLFQRSGFVEPDAVRIATADYRTASDHVGSFLADRCNVGPGLSVQSSVLYAMYKLWCHENGENVLSNKAFSLRLAERPDIAKVKGRGANVLEGVCIASHAVLGHLPLPGKIG